MVQRNHKKAKSQNAGSQPIVNEDKRSGGIYFGDRATVHGDVVGRDKVVTTTGEPISKETLLALLAELKTAVKQSEMDEEHKDIASGKIAAAVMEVKDTPEDDIPGQKDKVGQYLTETKSILDRVKDIGDIGQKVLPILAKIGKMIGLTLF